MLGLRLKSEAVLIILFIFLLVISLNQEPPPENGEGGLIDYLCFSPNCPLKLLFERQDSSDRPMLRYRASSV